MKKFLNIFLALILVLVCAFGMVACADDDTSNNEKGLKYKKYIGEDFYTVYGYVDDGITTDLTIQSEYDGVAVGRIASSAFANNGTIKKLVIPNSVTEIGAGAFAGMKVLEEITLPFVGKTANSDLYYGETAPATDKAVDIERTFCYVFGTELYSYGTTVEATYGSSESDVVTYYLPTSLAKVTISPKTAYSIPMYAFNGVHTLNEIVLNNIDAIGEGAFGGCDKLQKINIPGTVAKIWDNAFVGCSKLTTGGIVFEDVSANSALKEIASQAFYGTAITELVIPASVEYIGELAFANSSLQQVTLPEPCTLDKYAFYDCKNLTKVNYNTASNITLNGGVFQGCIRLDCSTMTGFIENGTNNFADTKA